MLCRKFELIPTSIFQVTAILRKHQKSEKYPRLEKVPVAPRGQDGRQELLLLFEAKSLY